MAWQYGTDYIDVTEAGADYHEYIGQRTMYWGNDLAAITECDGFHHTHRHVDDNDIGHEELVEGE